MKKIIFVLASVAIIVACSSDDSVTPDDSADTFDRKAMLINWADEIIIPRYEFFDIAVNKLAADADIFTDEVTLEHLNDLRNSWQLAYTAFQNVSMFEIGAAESSRFRDRLNSYPTNTDEILSNITEGNVDLSLPSTNDAQGFPALDYLLFGVAENDTAILEFYTSHPNAAANKNYVTSLVQSMHMLSEAVLTDWQNQYRDEFVNNDGSSASSSVDKLTNDFIFYYEKSLRAGKIGIPAGVFSNEPLPENVEGRYSKIYSQQLAVSALRAARHFFEGRSFISGKDELGYDDYLNYLNSTKNGDILSALISAQFGSSKAAIDDLDDNLYDQVQNDNNAMLLAYDALQRNVILLKVDMLQALSIDVDYIDADGD
ncbi:MAG: imelysin family protein [Marinirhabdus sp.]|nr:imelysin family protein [Marinirhabdus sp.]